MTYIKKLAALLITDDSGDMLIDSSVSICLVMMLTFGIMDCSRAVYINQFVATAARSATRYAMVRGSSWGGATCTSTSTTNCTATSDAVKNYVKSIATNGVSTNLLRVTTTWPGTTPSGAACDTSLGNDSPGCVVNVRVGYSYNFILPFLPTNSYALASSSTVTIAQ